MIYSVALLPHIMTRDYITKTAHFTIALFSSVLAGFAGGLWLRCKTSNELLRPLL